MVQRMLADGVRYDTEGDGDPTAITDANADEIFGMLTQE